jgi:fructosamine-3-kinase
MSFWDQVEQQLAVHLNRSVKLGQPTAAGGGSINQAWRVQSDLGKLFVKVNTADGLDMFAAEAEGLQELSKAERLRVPVPRFWGLADGQAYLVMDDLEPGGSGSAVELGEGLAAMHRITSHRYGWHRDNTIGSTPQINTMEDDWLDFWRQHRLGYQLSLAVNRGAGGQLYQRGQRLMGDLAYLFPGYRPQPSLLHGDLWSGNYAFTRGGRPAIFDPAVYYGDREADLAMTELFGGFSRDFYAAYENAWPLDEGYAVRKTLYNLYHVLNHFNLFGGGYLSQAQRMLDSLLSEIR